MSSCRCRRSPPWLPVRFARPSAELPSVQLSPSTLAALVEIIHLETGIALGPDKHYLLRDRIEPILKAHALDSYDRLVTRLRGRDDTGALRADLIDAITIHETSFFRDPDVFAAIGEHALAPALAKCAESTPARQLRIWSAATSTGQEAWSLAMLASELLSKSGRSPRSLVSILGSDISIHTIETARAGTYARRELARGLSEQRILTHFRAAHEGEAPAPRDASTVRDALKVRDALRECVQFRTFNLLERPASLGRFDLILCRNVLMYFDDVTRARVVHELAEVLLPGGILVLGSAESLYGLAEVPGPTREPITAKLKPMYFPRAILYQRLPLPAAVL